MCVLALSRFSCVRLFETLWTVTLCARDSPGKNTGVGCHALLQGIFPTPGSNPRLLTSPALAGGFFTTSATWEAHVCVYVCAGVCMRVHVCLQALGQRPGT